MGGGGGKSIPTVLDCEQLQANVHAQGMVLFESVHMHASLTQCVQAVHIWAGGGGGGNYAW